MFGKCFSYEIKLTWKKMMLLYIIAAVLFVMKMITQNFFSFSLGSHYMEVTLFALINILYALSETTITVYTIYVLCKDYKVTMFSQRGYLTHTLPVNTMTIFWAKIVNGMFWCAMTSIFQIIIMCFDKIFAKDSFSVSSFLIDEATNIIASAESTLSLLLCLLIIFGAFLLIFLLVTSIYGVGQLSNNHRRALSFLTGIVYYFLFNLMIVRMVAYLIDNSRSMNTITRLLIVLAFEALLNFMLVMLNKLTLTRYLNLQ